MNEIHELMQGASPDKRYRLACSFVKMVIAYNAIQRKDGTWQGGFRLDEWAALAMCYPWQKEMEWAIVQWRG